MKFKLKFRVEERPDTRDVDWYERPNDVVVMVGDVDIVRIPVEYEGGVYDHDHAERIIGEAVTPFLQRLFAPLEGS